MASQQIAVRQASWAPLGRRLHVIDLDNLTSGAAVPARLVGSAYRRAVRPGPLDQMVVATSHRSGFAGREAFPGCRLRWRSGPNGADLALLEELACVVAGRFDEVVIGSGDGIFAGVASRLAASAIAVTVVGRPRSVSTRLRLAANNVVLLHLPTPAPLSAAA